ncbi:MAG TPA: cysteine-rich CWC family protein [Rubrivivax sp.]|nr:cysteine-rich CWC family protein [Rubrivivax sp.]
MNETAASVPWPASAPDRCPRCGGGFSCGVAGSQPCPCTSVRLSLALQSRLRQQFSGCLCLACLQSLSDSEQGAQAAADETLAPA